MNADPVRVDRLIPDLDDELCHAMGQVEELLVTLARWEEDPGESDGTGEPVVLPVPVAGRVALGSLNRIQEVIAPTQTRTDRPAPAGRLWGPDGRHEHRPLRLVQIDLHDVRVIAAAASALGHALATNPHDELGEALAAVAGDSHGTPLQPVELVETLARIHELLDLAPTVDSARLVTLLTAAEGTDLVLDASDEVAYQRTCRRFTTVWAQRTGLDRFLY